MNELYKEWIIKAENDLLNIENNLTSDKVPYDTICFHSQQCAEKYIKAFLVYHNVEFPKIHDLENLIDNYCLQINSEFDTIKYEAVFLTSFAITTSYPGDFYENTDSEAKEAYQAALKIKEFVLTILSHE